MDLHGSLGCGFLAEFACTTNVSFVSSDDGIGVLGIRHCAIRDLPSEHRLTLEVLEGGGQQY